MKSSEGIIIRKASLQDKKSVEAAHIRSIREVCSKDYSKEQIEKWSALKYSDDVWDKTVNQDSCYLVVSGSVVYGFCHAKTHENNRGEIVGLYFTPEIIGQGLGRTVFDRCMKYLDEHNAKTIFIRGTKTAKGFYEAMGFKIIESGTLQVRGTDIEYYYMELHRDAAR